MYIPTEVGSFGRVPDNDPYVQIDKGKELAKNLGTELIILKGAGHINMRAGYTKFDFLLEKIKNEL